MPIPALNSAGILPAGEFETTLDEVKQRFVYNSVREKIWSGFIDFLASDGRALKGCPFLLDGSFTTSELNPKDIDVVVDLSRASASQQNIGIALHLFQQQHIKKTYSVDFWTADAIDSTGMRSFFKDMRTEFKLQHGLGPGARKGLLRIVQ